jgi:protein-S-isoprenylcysteine O-methyltransferase Ste14
MNHDLAMVLLGGLAFAVPHVALGFPPLRPWLVGRLGTQGFQAVFVGLAILGLGLFAAMLAIHGGGGGPGPGAGLGPGARGFCIGIATGGLLLALAALWAYPRNPAALGRVAPGEPRGVEKITRHGFFVGFGAFCLAHVLLADSGAQAVAFALLAGVSMVGAVFQDRKLRDRYGAAWQAYQRRTAIVPFLAVLQRRTQLVADDRLPATFARAALGVLAVAALHPLWTRWHGAAFVGVLAAGGAVLTAQRIKASRGARRLAPAPPAPSAPAGDPPGP